MSDPTLFSDGHDKAPPSALPTALPDRRVDLVRQFLRQAFAHLTGVDPAAIDLDRPLTALGIDSLMAIELQEQAAAGLGLHLSLADLLRGLSVAQLAHLATLPEPDAAEPESPGELPGEPRLATGQQALWFLDRLAPGGTAFHLVGAARLLAPAVPDVDELRRVFQILVERHAALRTTVAETAAGPVQCVAPHAEVDFTVEDVSGFGADQVLSRLDARAFEPFDLVRGPLFRVALFRGAPAGDLLLVAAHHIVADFWSLAVLVRDLKSLLAGGELEPPRPRSTFVDFAAWQAHELSARGAALWERWRQRLEGMPALDLPTDQPRGAGVGRRAVASPARIGAVQADSLRALARGAGATPFVVLLAGFQALLWRYCGQPRFLVGVPTSGRRSERWASTVGYFVNLVPFPADLAGDPTVSELVERVRLGATAALDLQDLPFARLIEHAAPARSAQRAPLVQALFSLQRSPVAGLEALAAWTLGEAGARLDLGRAVLESVPLAPPPAQVDLCLVAGDLGGDLALSLQLDGALFDRATADRMARHVANVLRSLAVGPHRRISELDLMDEGERWQALAGWNATVAALPDATGLHQPILAQAATAPEAIAVVHGHQQVSYGELARRALSLAGALRRCGVAAEVPVGVFSPRTPDLIVGLLGVLAAGGAYVPLDPTHPRDRLAALLADSAAPVVLAPAGLHDALPPYGGRVVRLDAPAGADPPAAAPPAGACHGEQLAYLIYTSGSTGRPKGVAVRHAGALAMVAWALSCFRPDQLAGVLAATSLSFDLSVFEIFVPLSAGGTAILADTPLALPALPAAHQVTLVNTVPSAMAALVAAVPPSVRLAVLAGEPLRRELVVALYGLPSIEDVYNLYGPSEDTTYSTGGRVPRQGGAPTLGLPLANRRAYVLDAHLSPLPAGVPGELWLGGAGLARGYLRNPVLTADAFRPDPFAALHGAAGSRLYRTGDLARRRVDGELEFLGRRDHQVKVRGVRIELEEIEAALASCPGVTAAAVAAREDGAGGRGLVAYVTPAEVGTAALRSLLRRRLPDAMVPSHWVALAALPRSPNGKVDRQALPAPAAPRLGEAAPVPPDSVEEAVAAIWSDLLAAPPAGAHADFFEAGGHSLLAMRLLARVRQAFAVDIDLRTFVVAPTVGSLAAAVAAALSQGVSAALPPIGRVARSADLPLSFSQQRLWLAHQLAGSGAAYNVPLVLRIAGALDAGALATALAALAARQESLRTTFPAPAGEPLQRIGRPAVVPLPWIDLAALPAAAGEAEAVRLAAAAARRAFDLAQGPVWRIALVHRDRHDHLLVLVLHHIVCDGWSLDLLVDDLADLYAAAVAGRPTAKPPLPVQYADFAHWQRAWLAGGELDRQRAYWRLSLAGAPQVLALPADRPRPPRRSFRGSHRRAAIPGELTASFEAFCRAEGATPFMGLLAAIALLLSRYANQDDLVVGSPIANRRRAEIDAVVGFFANTLVLRTTVAAQASWRELLAQARQTALAAYVHQDLPFEVLLDDLGVERSPQRSPLFQVMVSYAGAAPRSLDLGGLRAERCPVATGTAKFDLTLRIERRPAGLAIEAEYAADLFDPATVDGLLAALQTVLAGMVAAPAGRLCEVALGHTAVRRQVAQAGDAHAAQTLHDLLEEQVRRAPDAVAVECGQARLTFGELSRRSNRLAHLLRARGIAHESRVGICLPRAAEAIVAIFAILKAGGAYLPLDPSAPRRRLSYMLAQARVSLVLTSDELRASLPKGRHDLLPLDREPALAASGSPPDAAPPPLAGSGSLAYVLFTSGSTGLPKGVMIEHRAVANLLRALRDTAYLDAGGRLRVALNAPLVFDASVKQWAQILDGHTLHILPEDVRLDPRRLLALADRLGIEVLDCTPGQLAALLAPGPLAERCGCLRRVLVGGEEIAGALWETMRAQPAIRFFNVYGPTECTVDATIAEIGAPFVRPALGQPLANVHVQVLDPWLNPTPSGVPGELAISGAGLARGYLDRPDRTAERFLPDPWSAEAGARLYRSGDLARWRPDGTLEFLGRIDRQVKVRGFRIEMGEIEAVLAEHPAVREAAVVLIDDGRERSLTAWAACGSQAPPPDQHELRQHLQRKLPDYMMPRALAVVAELPRTRNGKLDRAALVAAPPATLAPRPPVHDLPPLEQVLAGMMSEVLGVARVDLDDSFFALGGHSLRALELISMVQQAFGLDVPLFQLFDSPTVAGIAAYFRQDPARQAQAETTAAILLRLTGGEPGVAGAHET